MKKIFTLIICMMLGQLSVSASTNGYYRGDIDGNKEVTLADLTALIKLLQADVTSAPKAADVTGDNKINSDDVSALVEILLGEKSKVWVPLPDDLSNDGDSTSGDVDETEYDGEFDSKARR